MPFKIVRNDITRVKADAIVNTANPQPTFGSGTDAAIYEAAGADALLTERRKIGRIAPGEAAVTSAFGLPAKYIIHTVGPAWVDGQHGEFEILQSCYRKSMLLADQLGCRSIAFPLIATGVYGFPKDKALQTALSVTRQHLESSDLEVILVVFGKESYQTAEGLTGQIEAYIDENYVEKKKSKEYGGAFGGPSQLKRRYALWGGASNFAEESVHFEDASVLLSEAPDETFAPSQTPMMASVAFEEMAAAQKPSLEDAVRNLGETFQARLLRMIDQRGLSDPEVYKRANIDRKLFSKIRCNPDYAPKKKTVLAFAIALKLNLDDAKDLLASAGYALNASSKSDVILQFCIENGIYDIFEVNALLFQFDQPILG